MQEICAALGSTVELEGILESEQRDEHPPVSSALIRFEKVVSLVSTRPWIAPTEAKLFACVLWIKDREYVINLDLSSLSPTHVLPYKRHRKTWDNLVPHLSLLDTNTRRPPADDILLEAIVSEVPRGAQVCVRGEVSEVRHSTSDSSAYREPSANAIATIRVTHIAHGPDAKQTMQAALNGVSERLPSVADSGLVVSAITIAGAAISATALLWTHSIQAQAYAITSALQFLALTAITACPESGALTLVSLTDRLRHSQNILRRVSTPFGGLITTLCVLPSVWVLAIIDVVRGLPPTGVPESNSKVVLVLSVTGAVVCVASCVLTLRRVLRTSALFWATTPRNRKDSVFVATIEDSTPVQGPFGHAAALLITEEEIIPGSNPNIEASRIEDSSGFAIKPTDGPYKGETLDVQLSDLEWSTTVYTNDIVEKNTEGNSVRHAIEIIPVGGQAMVVGHAVPDSSGRKRLKHSHKLAPMLVCAPHEDPRKVLRRFEVRAALGLSLAIVTALAAIALLVKLWPMLPNVPPGD
jgi:hypothetical protein